LQGAKATGELVSREVDIDSDGEMGCTQLGHRARAVRFFKVISFLRLGRGIARVYRIIGAYADAAKIGPTPVDRDRQ
jgi:hypothetical protein